MMSCHIKTFTVIFPPPLLTWFRCLWCSVQMMPYASPLTKNSYQNHHSTNKKKKRKKRNKTIEWEGKKVAKWKTRKKRRKVLCGNLFPIQMRSNDFQPQFLFFFVRFSISLLFLRKIPHLHFSLSCTAKSYAFCSNFHSLPWNLNAS